MSIVKLCVKICVQLLVFGYLGWWLGWWMSAPQPATEMPTPARGSTVIVVWDWEPPATIDYQFEFQFVCKYGSTDWIPTNDKYHVDFGLIGRNAGMEEVVWGNLDRETFYSVRPIGGNKPSGPSITKEEAASQLFDVVTAYKHDQNFIVKAFSSGASKPDIVITANTSWLD
jgi:hypothetical protein